jgi:hypothetical protein
MNGSFYGPSGAVNYNSNAGIPNAVIVTDGNGNVALASNSTAAAQKQTLGSGTTGGGAGKVNTPNAYTGAHTLTANENFVTEDTTSAGYAVTLPAASSSIGQEYTILNIGTSNSVTLTGNGSDNILLIGGSSANTQTIGSLTMYTVRCALNHSAVAQWYMR